MSSDAVSCAARQYVLQSSRASRKAANQQLQLKVVALERALLVVKPYKKMISDITTNYDIIKFYTGLPSCAVFHSLLEYMQPKGAEAQYATVISRHMLQKMHGF